MCCKCVKRTVELVIYTSKDANGNIVIITSQYSSTTGNHGTTGTTNTSYSGLMETSAGGNLVVDEDVAEINVKDHIYAMDNDYIASKKTYKITLYNVIKGLSVKYNGYLYHPDENNQVVFEDIAQGKNVLLYIYGESGCTSQVHTISVNAPYFNIFYGKKQVFMQFPLIS